MDGQAILVVSGATVALTQLLKWAIVPDKWGPLTVMGLALMGVAFWGWSQGVIDRPHAWEYFAGWIAVATSAAGVYGFTRAAASSMTQVTPPPQTGAGSERTRKEP